MTANDANERTGSQPDRYSEGASASVGAEGLFDFLRRAGYALAVVVSIPLFPFWMIGAYLNEGESVSGWFTDIATALLLFALILGMPFILLSGGVKWVFTGRGWGLFE